MSLKNLSVKTKIPKLFQDKLNNKKILQIYRRFEKTLNINENFAVAVSGGPDSLALAFLAKIYSLKRKLNPKFFIIDHKLRIESTKEAKFVKKILKQFSINLEILTWKGKKPSKNIQSIARNKRYQLLFTKCDKFKINTILLGHHRDDLFENFFIRLLRGSGLKGLVSFDKENKINNKNLLRPLLNQNKEDLLFLSEKVFNFYVKDPSNRDLKYQRIKIRKLIEELQENGLDKKKFLKTINNLKCSNDVLDFYVRQNLLNNTSFLKKDEKVLLKENLFQLPYEITFRTFSDSLKLIGKKYYAVRGKKLDRIIKNIKNNKFSKATLGGCIIKKVNKTVIISKEL